jgi:hypothetical protein
VPRKASVRMGISVVFKMTNPFPIKGPDEVFVDALEKLGYIPVSLRTRIQQRVNQLQGDLYLRAAELFLRFDLDFVGNETRSPQTYQQNRVYQLPPS